MLKPHNLQKRVNILSQPHYTVNTIEDDLEHSLGFARYMAIKKGSVEKISDDSRLIILKV